MAFVTINETYLEDIGNAIRSKNGETSEYRPKDMANAILNITSGVSTDSKNTSGESLTIANLFNQQASIIDEDGVRRVGPYFLYGQEVADVILRNATNILEYAFYYCKSLNRVVVNANQINSYAFANCSNLFTFVNYYEGPIAPHNELGESFYTANTFMNTPFANRQGWFYVPRSMISVYTSSPLWQEYIGMFRAIEDYPDICG